MSKKYAVFILTHGRPNNVYTIPTLRKYGYTGKIYLIVDDDDKTQKEYKKKYGNQVIMFNKKSYKGKYDVMDNFDNYKVILYARNAAFDIARNLNLDYYFQFDDDYIDLYGRKIEDDKLAVKPKNLDLVFKYMIDFMESTKVHTIAFAQGGDLIGGKYSYESADRKRKAMNTFLFKVHKDKKNDILFLGSINEDVNAYLYYGSQGILFFQIADMMCKQKETQQNKGGITETYKDNGTYVKSFYSVMICPSCCKIYQIGKGHKRLHHKINWKHAVPKIIQEHWKK